MSHGGDSGRGIYNKVEDTSNWLELRQTWAMMKATGQTDINWSSLAKELSQINFGLVTPFFIEDSLG